MILERKIGPSAACTQALYYATGPGTAGWRLLAVDAAIAMSAPLRPYRRAALCVSLAKSSLGTCGGGGLYVAGAEL